jgi:hypothetical protein
MPRKAVEVVIVGKPDELNKRPFYTPCGELPSGKKSCAFGGSEQYARRKARAMEREGRYMRVWIELSWGAGSYP